MKRLLVLLFLFVSVGSSAQTQTIRVLGQHNYVHSYQGYGAVLLFVDDPSKCDPEIGYVPLDLRLKHFKESLISKGITSPMEFAQEHSISHKTSTTLKQQAYRLSVTDSKRFDELILLCEAHDVTVKESFYSYPERQLGDQDPMAVNAFVDAKEKAHIIAAHIGFKVVDTLNVDDETRFASYDNLFVGYDFEKREELIQKYMDVMSAISSRSAESSSRNPTMAGTYSLWVTFEIEPL